MTKEEAWRIIAECDGWNTSQQSITGNVDEDAALDAKRRALANAWSTVGECDQVRP